MRKIFTLVAFAAISFFASAQVTQDFNGDLPGCFTTEANFTNGSLDLGNSGLTVLTTPYINFSASTADISFTFYSNKAIQNNKSRKFFISIVDINGLPVSLSGEINNPTYGIVSRTLNIPNLTNPYKVIITYQANGGQPSAPIFDNLLITNASYHYGATNPCNQNPVANDDEFGAVSITETVMGNVITKNISDGVDTDPNGEAVSAIPQTNVVLPEGILNLTSDGEFKFTPNDNFKGGFVSFDYTITDNGFPALTSNATVTIEYPAPITLPVNFVSFDAKAEGNGTKLTWKVADQIDVLHYDVERSTNGNNFTKIGEVKASDITTYAFTDRQPAQGTVYYRIKNVDVDGKYKYSTIVSVRNGTSAIVVKAFPSPAKNNVTLQHGSANAQTLIRISAQDGRQLKAIRPAAGSMQTGIDLSAYAPGLYILSFDSGNGQVENIKLIKQ